MDAAKQLRNEPVPFTPRAQSTASGPPLQIAMNPFVAGGSVARMGRPMQTAFGEIVRQIALKTPGVLVVGETGTGKSLLMDLTARACAEMGLSVRRIERGEQLRSMPDGKIDVLLIDEADTIPESGLRMLLPQGGQPPAATMVFMCPPSSADRFNLPELRIAAIALTPLSHADARTYLQERAASIGRANLFTPEAMNLVIEGSRGLLRLLRSIAHLAYYAAASEGVSQIGVQHVSAAAEPASPAPKPVASVAVPQTPPAAYQAPKREIEPPAPTRPAAEKQPAKPEPALSRPQPRQSADTWSPRVIGIAGTLVASVAIGAVVSWLAMSPKSEVAPRTATAPAAVSKPAPVAAQTPQAPAPAATATATAQAPQQAPARKDVAVTRPAAPPPVSEAAEPKKAETTTARTNAQAPAPAPAALPQAAPPVRENPVAANAAPAPAEKPADTVATPTPPPAPPVATIVEQPTPAPDLAAAQAEAQRAAEAKAAEEKAAAERAKAAEQARLAAEEAEKKARAEKVAAELAKAAKEVEEQAAASRRRNSERFKNSFMGVGR